MVSNRLVWSKAQQTLAAQANKSVSFILKTTKSVNFVDIDMLWTLFDHMVLPILTYGSQIWGCDTAKCVEQVQNKFCKFLLKLPNQAVNVAVRGECGRLPIKVTATLNVLKYWCKLVCMDNNILPKSCNKMIYALDLNGRVTWATKVKHLMYNSGFGIVWLSQEIGNVSLFLIEAKQRLIDIAHQEWHSDLNQCSKLQTLCEFKSLLNPERYLSHVTIVKHRISLSRLRLSVHNLAIETGRHINIDPELRTCKYCNSTGENLIEDEFHFVLICPLYKIIRLKLIANNIVTYPSTENFVNLFSSKDPVVLKGLAKYVFEAFKLRDNVFVNL